MCEVEHLLYTGFSESAAVSIYIRLKPMGEGLDTLPYRFSVSSVAARVEASDQPAEDNERCVYLRSMANWFWEQILRPIAAHHRVLMAFMPMLIDVHLQSSNLTERQTSVDWLRD